MTRVTILLMVLLLLLATAGCQATEDTNVDPTPPESSDDAQIYAAAIREIHTDARSKSQVYVVTKTEDLAIFDGPTGPSRLLPIHLQEAITAELADERFELSWIEAFDDAPFEPANWREAEGWQVAGGDGILVTLGNIHPQDDGSVQLSFFMTCADMCGVGKNFVMNESFGNWHVTGSVGPEIAS